MSIDKSGEGKEDTNSARRYENGRFRFPRVLSVFAGEIDGARGEEGLDR